MARSTYHDQFHKLVDRGYLVPARGNTYDFYEVPRSATQVRNELLADGLDFEECPRHDEQEASGGHAVLPENIEINNMTDTPNNTGINMMEQPIQKPQVKEIVIPRPVAEGRNRPKPIERPKIGAFDF